MSTHRSRRIFVASLAGVAQRVVQLVVTLITLPLVLHSLGVAGFGTWAAATSLAWLSSMLDLGLGSALVTLIPRSLAVRGREHCSRYTAASLQGGSVLGVLALGAIWLPPEIGLASYQSMPFMLALTAVAINIPLSIAGEIWLGLQKGHVRALWQVLQSALTLIALAALARLNAGVTALAAAPYAAMLTANALCLAHVLLRYPWLRPRGLAPAAVMREVLSQGGMMFLITVAASCAFGFDNVLALAWLGPAAAAQMAIAMRICVTASGLLGVVTVPFWPGFADAHGVGDCSWLRSVLHRGTAGTALLSVLGGCCLVAAGRPALSWWLHGDIEVTWPSLLNMAIWIFATTLPQISGLLLHAVLILRPQLFILGPATVLSFLLKWELAQWAGVNGILAATSVLWLVFVFPAYYSTARNAVQRLELQAK